MKRLAPKQPTSARRPWLTATCYHHFGEQRPSPHFENYITSTEIGASFSTFPASGGLKTSLFRVHHCKVYFNVTQMCASDIRRCLDVSVTTILREIPIPEATKTSVNISRSPGSAGLQNKQIRYEPTFFDLTGYSTIR